MKKLFVISALALAVVAAIALGITGWAFAQAPDPQSPTCPYCGSLGYGPGMMGGRGGYRGQAGDGSYGPMHETMFSAIAEAFGLTPEELQAAHAEGKTLLDIAQEQGKTVEEFQALMSEARASAFEKMVADGVLTQKQADWMLERMQSGRNGAGMIGAGGCPGMGSFGPGGRGGWRGNAQP